MSITGLRDYKKPSHRRKTSDELDVFEAARYYNDNFALVGGANNMAPKMVMRDQERDHGYLRGGRISLDIPSLKHHHYYHHNHHLNHHPNDHNNHHNHQQQTKEIKKQYKQPSSPGRKLAHFLNSLFNQTSSKKKKTSKSTTQSMKDEDESPNGRRKRRSSISHFRSTSSVSDAKSIYSCTSSYSDHKDVNHVLATLSKYNINPNYGNGNSNKDEKIRGSNLDEKIKFKSGFVEQPKKSTTNHGYQDKNRGINKFSDELDDDGVESDSSSDLFELQIDYGLGFCSSGLPVYETTHIDNIKRFSASTTTATTTNPV